MKLQYSYRWLVSLSFVLILILILATQTPATATTNPTYHGNIKSKVFHITTCRYYNCKNCIELFKTRAAAIKSGYRACKICKP